MADDPLTEPESEPGLDEQGNVIKKNTFTAKQRTAILAALIEKTPDSKCEMCGHNTWTLCTSPVSPLVLVLGESLDEISTNLALAYPCAMIQCTTCGNSKLHGLNYLGADIIPEQSQ